MSEEENNKKDNFLKVLMEIGEIHQEAMSHYAKEAEDYWNSLTYEQKLMCFFTVTKKIHQGDCLENRSYRGVIYDIFEFDADAYGLGMYSGYFNIHNMILSKEEIARFEKMEDLINSDCFKNFMDSMSDISKKDDQN